MHLSMTSPTPPPPGLDGEFDRVPCQEPLPGALPDVNTPIYHQESIGD